MKKGHLYLVVDDRQRDHFLPYHYHLIGELVECIGEHSDDASRFIDEKGTAQWMLPEHVIEIGKI